MRLMQQPPRHAWAAMTTYALTIFLSAFLLFLVQPIIAKLILPWFGGAAAVWATCMVFFQAALLAGYGYAHWLVRKQSNTLLALHLAALIASLFLLPIVPSMRWQPSGDELPSLQILLLLIPTIGLPYLLLATTSPLLQAWLAQAFPGKNPYRLFALSNLASLGALLSYPWLIEPWWTTTVQARGWSFAYVLYVVLVAGLTVAAVRRGGRAPAGSLDDTSPATAAPRAFDLIRWTALAALASFMLLAVTNHLTQNIPSFPMMWVIPLSIYLLTFVLCFDGRGWYRPALFTCLCIVALFLMMWLLVDSKYDFRLLVQSAVFLSGLFAVCMLCHGEIASSKPAPAHLTIFYFCVSFGGVLGGALVGLGAPLLLSGYFELEIGLIATALLVALKLRRLGRLPIALGVLVFAGTAASAAYSISEQRTNLVAERRSFYGVLRVIEYTSTNSYTLMHGAISHGDQMLAPDKRGIPTSYYVESSGVGMLLRSLEDRALRVGLIGLGVGTLAAYGKPGDTYRFFEIDPNVLEIAQRHFSYLKDSRATVQTVIGDGRLSLTREPDAAFDVLVVDAFSSDSIPMHLITREAIALYLQKLSNDGVIALHISNRFLELLPIVLRLARELKLSVLYVDDAEPAGKGGADVDLRSTSDWVLLARHEDALDHDLLQEFKTDVAEPAGTPLWTDDHNNILQALKF